MPASRKFRHANSDWQLRICLSCTKKFKSWGVGNRICKNCTVNMKEHTNDIPTHKSHL